MLTIPMIREDLRNIKYYAGRKAFFDKASQSNLYNSVLSKVKLYNKAIQSAPARLYDVYVSLYLENHTQESLAEKLGYSAIYIYTLNRDLLKFFSKTIKEEDYVQV